MVVLTHDGQHYICYRLTAEHYINQERMPLALHDRDVRQVMYLEAGPSR